MVQLKLEEITFEPLIYPRKLHGDRQEKLVSGQMIAAPFWIMIARLKRGMAAGAKVPPIIVTRLKGKIYLVDGLQRLIAATQLKWKTINVEFMTFKSLDEAYAYAVRTNNQNGQPLTESEITQAIINLGEKGYSKKAIAEILCMTVDDVQAIRTKRVFISENGTEFALKKPLLTVRDRLPEDFKDESQKLLSGYNQKHTLRELITLIESELLDIDDQEIAELVTKLHYLLSQMIVPMRPGRRKFKK